MLIRKKYAYIVECLTQRVMAIAVTATAVAAVAVAAVAAAIVVEPPQQVLLVLQRPNH
jgi:hypothetical protein